MTTDPGTTGTSPAGEPEDTRCGYVALLGRPNAGKSTLLNRLVGEKLSIVSPRAQTTWQRVTGIRTEGGTQMIFLDTPGLLDVRDLHQRAMLGAAHEALDEADVVVLVLDGRRIQASLEHREVARVLVEVGSPIIMAVNKMDAMAEPDVQEAVAAVTAAVAHRANARVVAVSALDGTGVEELLDAVAQALPPGPFLYPEDHLAMQSTRFFVAEMVRETVFELFDEEIPYSVVTRVEEFRESEDPVYIAVSVFVERPSQKGIVVGKGGRAIRELGTRARRKIETFLQRPVYLDLWVKPLQGWRRKRQHLARLGYRIPEDDQS